MILQDWIEKLILDVVRFMPWILAVLFLFGVKYILLLLQLVLSLTLQLLDVAYTLIMDLLFE
jgi:hypothetical protein